MGTRKKWTLYFRCVGIPTHIKQQNNNNNIKKITLYMSSPPKIWGKSLHFQGYFHFYCRMSRLEYTTLKPIYGFWANGEICYTRSLGALRAPTSSPDERTPHGPPDGPRTDPGEEKKVSPYCRR